MRRALLGLGLAALLGCPPTTQDQSLPPGLTTRPLPAAYEGRTNPFSPDDAQVLEEGRRLYLTPHQGLSCAVCHGNDGRGRGPMWTYIEPYPPSFADEALLDAFRERQDHVFRWVADGLDRMPMPGFGQVMTEEEIWKVITYAWHLGLQLERRPDNKASGGGP